MSDLIPEPAADPAAEAEAPAEWGGVSQDEWTHTQELLEQQQAALGQIVQALTPQQEQPEFDPYDPSAIDARIEQRLQPFQQMQNELALERGDQMASEMLSEIVTRDGGFLLEGSQEKARALADSYLPAALQSYRGANGQPDIERAAKAVLEQAAKDVREWEQQVGKAYYERELNQIRGLSGAPQDPGVNQSGAAQQLHVTPGGPKAVLAKYTQGNYTQGG